MTLFDQRLAERMLAKRKLLGLSQPVVAERLRDRGWTGATYRLVQDVERGRRRLKGAEPRLFAAALEEDPDRITHGLGVPGETVTIQGIRAIAHAHGNPPQ